MDRERSCWWVTFSSRCGPVELWWLGQERWRETKLGSGASAGPARLGPGAINYNLIEGYRGDPTVIERRTEVVIEEGVLFPLSLSSPEAPSAGTILVLAKDCGERCLTVSIYARHLQDINNLFPCCSAHCFHWCILWLWNWCLKLHCLNQLFTSFLLEHQFYFTLHTCLLPFFYLATFHQFLALLPPSLPLNILTALWTFLQHVCWSVWHANLSAVWLVTLVFSLLNTWTCLVLTLGSLYVSLHRL